MPASSTSCVHARSSRRHRGGVDQADAMATPAAEDARGHHVLGDLVRQLAADTCARSGTRSTWISAATTPQISASIRLTEWLIAAVQRQRQADQAAGERDRGGSRCRARIRRDLAVRRDQRDHDRRGDEQHGDAGAEVRQEGEETFKVACCMGASLEWWPALIADLGLHNRGMRRRSSRTGTVDISGDVDVSRGQIHAHRIGDAELVRARILGR